jgi:hypothetical protein
LRRAWPDAVINALVFFDTAAILEAKQYCGHVDKAERDCELGDSRAIARSALR